jgi:hypothetical protein
MKSSDQQKPVKYEEQTSEPGEELGVDGRSWVRGPTSILGLEALLSQTLYFLSSWLELTRWPLSHLHRAHQFHPIVPRNMIILTKDSSREHTDGQPSQEGSTPLS